jgi:flagellum-specific peptidoglycan hydrolase FlgJ
MIAKNFQLLQLKYKAVLRRYSPFLLQTLRIWLPRLLMLGLVYFLFIKDRFSIQINVNEAQPQAQPVKTKSFETQRVALPPTVVADAPAETSAAGFLTTAKAATLTEAQKKEAENYSNLGFVLNPNYARENNISAAIVAYKQQKCADYIAMFLPIAKEEARLFGVPAAITMAQALLESNAGDSNLAALENNHFGLQCTKKGGAARCAKYVEGGKSANYQVFDSPWFSFRANTKLLNSSRYAHLLQLEPNDYENWAYGLQAAGYSNEPQYGQKLIAIIKAFRLDKL